MSDRIAGSAAKLARLASTLSNTVLELESTPEHRYIALDLSNKVKISFNSFSLISNLLAVPEAQYSDDIYLVMAKIIETSTQLYSQVDKLCIKTSDDIRSTTVSPPEFEIGKLLLQLLDIGNMLTVVCTSLDVDFKVSSLVDVSAKSRLQRTSNQQLSAETTQRIKQAEKTLLASDVFAKYNNNTYHNSTLEYQQDHVEVNGFVVIPRLPIDSVDLSHPVQQLATLEISPTENSQDSLHLVGSTKRSDYTILSTNSLRSCQQIGPSLNTVNPTQQPRAAIDAHTRLDPAKHERNAGPAAKFRERMKAKKDALEADRLRAGISVEEFERRIQKLMAEDLASKRLTERLQARPSALFRAQRNARRDAEIKISAELKLEATGAESQLNFPSEPGYSVLSGSMTVSHGLTPGKFSNDPSSHANPKQIDRITARRVIREMIERGNNRIEPDGPNSQTSQKNEELPSKGGDTQHIPVSGSPPGPRTTVPASAGVIDASHCKNIWWKSYINLKFRVSASASDGRVQGALFQVLDSTLSHELGSLFSTYNPSSQILDRFCKILSSALSTPINPSPELETISSSRSRILGIITSNVLTPNVGWGCVFVMLAIYDPLLSSTPFPSLPQATIDIAAIEKTFQQLDEITGIISRFSVMEALYTTASNKLSVKLEYEEDVVRLYEKILLWFAYAFTTAKDEGDGSRWRPQYGREDHCTKLLRRIREMSASCRGLKIACEREINIVDVDQESVSSDDGWELVVGDA